jgi:hypothetical protein
MSSQIIKRDYVADFKAAFSGAIDGIVKASEIYVKAIDADPKLKDKFISECSGFIPAGAWAEFEAVGRKWKHPKLILGGGAHSSLVKLLPYSDQEKLFSGERVSVLTSKGDVLKVDINSATPDQAALLIDKTNKRIRDIPAQKAYLESVKPEKVIDVQAVEMPYTIAGGKVHFRQGTILGRKEISRILKELA